MLAYLPRRDRRGAAMTNPSHAKGARAEREIAAILSDQLGIDCKRLLGAGRKADVGDLHALGPWVGQVADWQNALRAVREKPIACEQQQINAAATFGVSFIRLRGGVWRAVQTIDQWSTVWRETT